VTDQYSLTSPQVPKQAEVVIAHCTLIPGPFLPVIENGAIHIKGDKILATGDFDTVRALAPGIAVIDASHSVVMPGMFNAHSHVAMGFFRGLGHGKTNMIESFLFPAEKNLRSSHLEPLSYSYIYDGLRSGVTSFIDHYYFSQGIGKAFERLGVRAWIGETVADLGGAFPGRESWDRARALIEGSSFGPLISHMVAPHAADTVSFALLKECAAYAHANNLPLHMHLSQTQGEHSRVMARDGMSPVTYAAKAGALTASSLIVHLTSANHDDLAIIKKSGATIGYCPTSTILYDKLAPIKDFCELGIPLALGSDCAASNDSADILQDMKFAGLLAKDRQIPQQYLSPDHLLAMATTIPAALVGRSTDLGTLEPGKLADLVILKQSLSSYPAQEPLANVIYSMGSRDVTHVMINGRWSVWNQSLASANELELRKAYMDAVHDIQSLVN
jgi:5-methylthioadenosine/S-adenosylhomocysteine deaminase